MLAQLLAAEPPLCVAGTEHDLVIKERRSIGTGKWTTMHQRLECKRGSGMPKIHQINISVDDRGDVLRCIMHGQSIRLTRPRFEKHPEIEIAVRSRAIRRTRTEHHNALDRPRRKVSLQSLANAGRECMVVRGTHA